MQEIDIQDFLNLKSTNIQIIDIREEYEFEEGHISKLNIPMDQILDSIEKIERKINIIRKYAMIIRAKFEIRCELTNNL